MMGGTSATFDQHLTAHPEADNSHQYKACQWYAYGRLRLTPCMLRFINQHRVWSEADGTCCAYQLAGIQLCSAARMCVHGNHQHLLMFQK